MQKSPRIAEISTKVVGGGATFLCSRCRDGRKTTELFASSYTVTVSRADAVILRIRPKIGKHRRSGVSLQRNETKQTVR